MWQQPDEVSRQGVRQNEADHAASMARSLGAVLRMQTLVSLLLALGLLLIGPMAAYSSLCGSVAVYLPGLLFTMLVSRKIGGSSAAFLSTVALAEFGKFILTGVLCAVVFIWIRPLAPVWFFVGMLAVLVTGWIGLAKAVR
jgi:F0F1-type ATP synthase assembly protein I